MQSRLEEVLRDKEREFKLYQRFLQLKKFCEDYVFPSSSLPLKQHIEDLTKMVERILPDPKDRTEEMFSGEIFTLLGIIYLHDIDKVKDYRWKSDGLMMSNIFNYNQSLLHRYGLKIPEMAMEVINYFSFSNKIKKLPIELEITEDNKKAVIRNTKVIGHIFNFAHLLLDIFFSDIKFSKLRRFNDSKVYLRKDDVNLDIDNREGTITINYTAKFPYEMHMLDNARGLLEDMFYLFKDNVNGKLGMNYREIIWDIRNDFNYEVDLFEIPKFSPYNEYELPPVERWEKASMILDRLFNTGTAIVVGGESTGKTTILKSFVIPQLSMTNRNVFYCEMWERPVSEARDIICKKYKSFSQTGLDIISLCKRLLEDEPCYFILDNCERYAHITKGEQEKFERFIKFCLEQENIFIIASGDKDSFFEWFLPFKGTDISSICEVKPIRGEVVKEAYEGERVLWDTDQSYKPIELAMIRARMSPEKVLADILKDMMEDMEFRGLMAVFVDKKEKVIKRFSVEDLYCWTSMSKKRITGYINALKERDIIIETESLGNLYYHLSGRYLIEPLYNILKLDEFEEKKRIRNYLKNSIVNRTFLEKHDLETIKKWKDHMVFTREESGVILASLIMQSMDYADFFEKAMADGKGIDIQPLLQILYVDDATKRAKAIEVLTGIKDKDMINPLLIHLKNEDVPEIKDLLIKGICMTKRKRAILAIVNTLNEIGDKSLLLKAIDFFYYLFDGNARQLLVEIKEKEDDPVVLSRIEDILSKI
ncbi:MAG TPA: HEAT repeat domain-containing protein [Syntrophorhabdaceae bacterium]|nr:HEAT repeat domain-containing protein [Syntrophorhabdaceae bacterium]HOL06232.1 HEAT repeat domain-containing protein [Syntrophorhabdaceae bacterium]HPP42319.1 HEAT repeat domain-containing protein [Syntrophorhabdaceae bacterium]